MTTSHGEAAFARDLETRLIELLTELGPCTAWDLAGRLCPMVHGLVQPTAAQAILAELARLAQQGRLARVGRESLFAEFATPRFRARAA